MLVIVPICDRIRLLPFFLRYYTSIGATQFEIALYNGKSSPFFKDILRYKNKYNLHVRPSISCPLDDYNGALVAPALNEIRREQAARFPWYCIADLDEFHYFGGAGMREIVAQAEHRGYDAVHGVFHDRIAADGSFPEVQAPLDETFPLACDLTRVYGGCADKITLAKNHLPITGGHHGSGISSAWRNQAEVHHFKWVKGIAGVMEHRHHREKKQNIPWADNLPRLLRVIQQKVDLTDPRLNVRRAARLGL